MPSRDRLRGLGWHILLWMALVALGPLLVMAVQGYHCARQAIVASEAAHLESVLAARRARIDAWVAQIGADLHFLESSPCVRGVCGGGAPGSAHSCGDVCNLLADLQRGSPAYDRISSYDASWRLLAESAGAGCCAPGPAGSRGLDSTAGSSAPEVAADAVASVASAAEGTEPSQEIRAAVAAAAATTGPLFGSPRRDADGGLVYEVGRRVAPMAGSTTAFLVGQVNASRVLDPILQDRAGLGETGRAYVRTPLGTYPPSSGQPLTAAERGERELAPGHGVRRYRGARGAAVLGVRSALPDLGATLVVEIDEREAFAWLRTLRVRAAVTGLVTLAVVLVLAARTAHRLAGPLRELAAVARRIAGGQTEERVGPLAGAEAAEVGAAVNRMLDELAVIHARLQRQASLAAIGELSSSVVHEMRNPLSSIKMNLQALQAKVAGDAVHGELAQIAVTQVQRLERLLTELLGYGKPLALVPAPVRFGPLAADVIALTQTLAAQKRVRVEVEDRLRDTPFVADVEQLRRALTNLVTNAVQAAPEGGHVRLVGRGGDDAGETARDRVRAGEAGGKPTGAPAPGGDIVRGRVRLEVLDDGGGIPPAVRSRLFEPFFTTRGEGTGLGLAIVKKIAEYHGGSVSAGNRPEGGAVFAIELPLGGAAA